MNVHQCSRRFTNIGFGLTFKYISGHFWGDFDAVQACLVIYIICQKLLNLRRNLDITVPNIHINNFILTPVKTVTYLGIEIDESFSGNKQIEILAKKAQQNKQYFAEALIYYNLFQSYIVYGSRSFKTHKDMKKIFALQKKYVRVVIF